MAFALLAFCLAFLFSPFSFIIFSIFALYYKKKYSKKSASSVPALPPGPKPWPIIGCLVEMLSNKPTFRWLHKLMEEMNVEIMCTRLGKTHVITVTSPEIACEFLRRQDAVFSSRPTFMSASLISGGYLSTVLTPMGDQWKKMKRILASHILSPARHQWLHGKRVQEADHLIHYVYNQCMNSMTGGLVNVRVTAQHYCGNVIRKIIFSKRFVGMGMEDGGPGAEEIEQVDALFTILKYLYSFCISDYIPCLRGLVDLDGHERIMRTAIASVTKYQDHEIDERIKSWANGTKKVEEDLLDVLVMLKDSNGSPLLSPQEIKSQILELMLATVDNPSNAVEWALAEMLNKPETLEKAMEELDRVVGRERLVQESDLPNLNYVKACVKEAFRLHPIAPFNVPHVSMEDTIVAGYFIPKGSHVLLSRPGLGRNPRVWEDALEFKPERHLKDCDSNVSFVDPNLRLLSFSIGRRGCMGVTLGTTMTTILMARLLHCFTWNLPSSCSKFNLNESPDDLLLAEPLLLLAKPRLNEALYISV